LSPREDALALLDEARGRIGALQAEFWEVFGRQGMEARRVRRFTGALGRACDAWLRAAELALNVFLKEGDHDGAAAVKEASSEVVSWRGRLAALLGEVQRLHDADRAGFEERARKYRESHQGEEARPFDPAELLAGLSGPEVK